MPRMHVTVSKLTFAILTFTLSPPVRDIPRIEAVGRVGAMSLCLLRNEKVALNPGPLAAGRRYSAHYLWLLEPRNVQHVQSNYTAWRCQQHLLQGLSWH